LARDPARLLGAFRLPGDAVIGRWEPYVALLPQFILSRAARALAPPAAIALQLVADTLVARGAATDAWFERASLLAPALPGVGTFVAERLAPRDLPALAPLVAAVESRRILFPSGLAAVDSTAAPTAEGIIADLRRLDSAASGLGFRVRAGVVGSADDIGSEEQNDRLRIERADRVRAYLLPQLPAAVGLWAAAAAPDTIPATSDAERAARRAVTVVVELAGSVGGVPGRP
jgi:outer membrane protein OmpA-like peptidoglycan-associated protein